MSSLVPLCISVLSGDAVSRRRAGKARVRALWVRRARLDSAEAYEGWGVTRRLRDSIRSLVRTIDDSGVTRPAVDPTATRSHPAHAGRLRCPRLDRRRARRSARRIPLARTPRGISHRVADGASADLRRADRIDSKPDYLGRARTAGRAQHRPDRPASTFQLQPQATAISRRSCAGLRPAATPSTLSTSITCSSPPPNSTTARSPSTHSAIQRGTRCPAERQDSTNRGPSTVRLSQRVLSSAALAARSRADCAVRTR